MLLRSCLLWPHPRGPGPGQSSPKQCPVCAAGRGIHGPPVTAAAGERTVGCFHPSACHRRLSKQIPPNPDTCRAAGNTHTAGVPLWGALRLSHTTVTSKKCHLPAPHHCTCSGGQEQLLALPRYPMPRGDASRLQARMELDSVLTALPKSPQPHTLHRAMHVLPCAQASAHRDRECCQLQ